MQKLLTIYFHETTYSDTQMKNSLRFGDVHEHLDDYLNDGWVVKMMVPVGSGHGAGGGENFVFETGTCGWLAVLLEK